MRRAEDLAPRRSDEDPWHWLLVLPIVLPLLVPVFNRVEPTLSGRPFSYWVQLAFVVVGVVTRSLVYRAHQRRMQAEAWRASTPSSPPAAGRHRGSAQDDGRHR